MPAKKIPYLNKFTGEVLVVTKQKGKQLNEDWQKIEFTQNEDGKRVMRLHLHGATVDVSENEEKEVVKDGIATTE